ncbi:MAG: hypothetical protein M3O86_05170, partial [Actinomycetota bacterium]|nr:hypothetical protein [Actinomycetota bacterium]
DLAACPLHAAHSGPHERASCGMVKLGAVEVSTDAGIGQLEVRGTLAAVVQRENGRVALVDVSNPAAPRVLGRYDGNTGRAQLDDPFDGDVAFSADGRYLFYARQTHSFSNDGIHVVDVSDPAQPRQADYVAGGGTLRVGYHATADAEYVVTLDAVAGVTVFRFVRTPAGGRLVPLFVDPLPATKVGGPASAGVVIDPRDPVLGIPLLYVATGRTGLEIYDFTAPASPRKLGAWSGTGLADIAVRATATGRTVYAATEYWFDDKRLPRLVELDATNLAAITERARTSPAQPALPAGVPWRVQGLDLVGEQLYVAHSHAGLGVLDACCATATPRATTTDLGEGNTAGEFRTIAPYAMDVEVAGDVVYVSDAATGTLTTFRLEP